MAPKTKPLNTFDHGQNHLRRSPKILPNANRDKIRGRNDGCNHRQITRRPQIRWRLDGVLPRASRQNPQFVNQNRRRRKGAGLLPHRLYPRAGNLSSPISGFVGANELATFARLKSPVQPIGLELVYYAKRTKAALAIWQTSESITGSLAEKYLASRGLTLPGTPALRFHSRLRHSSGLFLPAMVALVRRLDGEPVGIHRTFLKHDGTGKADVVPQRLMLGPCRGGCVRLGLADAEIMVGEGIETTISAMISTGKVGWAALSTSGLRALDFHQPFETSSFWLMAMIRERLPRSLRPGVGAEKAAAIRVARPPDGGDFNDILMDALEKRTI